MAGSGRKRKREEKAKVQLKKSKTAPGKHLPKGTNETKTQFKVTKIVIPGQVSEADKSAGPLTKKKLTLKDVLAKLGHFSVTVRTDGLEGLKELVCQSSGPALVAANLSSILPTLVPSTQDKEKKVRQLGNSVLSSVLSLVGSPSSLAPLHPLLSAHVCCALTHIDPRIQQSALETLDCLISLAPSFIQSCMAQLLPNCLDQISAKHSIKGGSSKGPNVAANLDTSLSSLQWRMGVLNRIDRILGVVTQQKKTSKGSREGVGSTLVQFVPEANNCFPLAPLVPSPTLTLKSLNSQTNNNSTEEQINLILPLLLETWVEARASEKGKPDKDSCLAPEVAQLLVSQAGILDKLLILMDEKVLATTRTKFGTDINNHYMASLPYSCSSVSGIAMANICLCNLGLALGHNIKPGVLKKVLRNSSGADTDNQVDLLVRLLPELSTELRGVCVTCLDKLSLVSTGQQREQVIQLLRKEALRPRPVPEVTHWVTQLPKRLLTALKEESQDSLITANLLLDCCLALAKTLDATLANSWRQHQENIKDLIPGSEVDLLQKFQWTHHHCSITPPG